jgi:hypothetical protein
MDARPAESGPAGGVNADPTFLPKGEGDAANARAKSGCMAATVLGLPLNSEMAGRVTTRPAISGYS